jgi:malonyl-CoA O-methyltransferase
MEPLPQKLVLPTDQGYDRWSFLYDLEDNPLIALESEIFLEKLGEVRGLRVLDLGCGTGRQTLRMAQAGARVTGVDFSEGMLRRAAAKPGAEGVRFVKHDLESRLPFEDAAFDRVVSCLVLEHIQRLDLFFAEIGRVCKPDGLIVLSAMHPAMMLRGVEAHFHDPETGQEVWPAGARNQVSDFVMAASRAGLAFAQMSEHVIDERLAERSPRARKHLGWPLLLMMCLRPSG